MPILRLTAFRNENRRQLQGHDCTARAVGSEPSSAAPAGKSFKLKCLSLKYLRRECHHLEHRAGRRHRMKIACLGGGPAGLYFAISMKLRDAAHDITVFERNRPDDTFGWGVVFSDETLRQHRRQRSGQRRDDPRAFRLLGRHRGPLSRPARGLERPRLFRHRAQEAADAAASSARASLASTLRFQTEIASAGELAKDYDLVVAADGLNSRTRAEFARRISSRRSIPARTNSSGSARSRNSTTPSPSSSRRPSTAGSGRTPISSTPTPRLSSSNARKRPGRSSVSAR